jgi:hypothetical protein
MQLEGGVAAEAKLNPHQVLDVIIATERQAKNLNSDAFKTLKVTGTAFGGYEGAQVVVSTHRSAHSVATETIRGVREDLEGFVAQLRAALISTTEADELSEASLRKMADVEVTDHGNANHSAAVHSTGFATNGSHVADPLPPTTQPAPGVCAAPGEES